MSRQDIYDQLQNDSLKYRGINTLLDGIVRCYPKEKQDEVEAILEGQWSAVFDHICYFFTRAVETRFNPTERQLKKAVKALNQVAFARRMRRSVCFDEMAAYWRALDCVEDIGKQENIVKFVDRLRAEAEWASP